MSEKKIEKRYVKVIDAELKLYSSWQYTLPELIAKEYPDLREKIMDKITALKMAITIMNEDTTSEIVADSIIELFDELGKGEGK